MIIRSIVFFYKKANAKYRYYCQVLSTFKLYRSIYLCYNNIRKCKKLSASAITIINVNNIINALIYITIIVSLYTIDSIVDIFLIEIIESIAINKSISEYTFRDYRFAIIKVFLIY